MQEDLEEDYDNSRIDENAIDVLQTTLYKNFKCGDFIYGLKGDGVNIRRDTFVPELAKKFDNYIIVDNLNNQFLVPKYFDEDGKYNYPKDTIDPLAQKVEDYKQYLFQHQKYSPFIFSPSLGGKQRKPKRAWDNYFLARSCKAAIERPNCQIHFCLDGIDMNIVVAKKYKPLKSRHPIRDERVTPSELRFIYRNKEKLKDKVLFYEQGELCSAPWDIDPELWKTYMPGIKSPAYVQQTFTPSSHSLNRELFSQSSPDSGKRRCVSSLFSRLGGAILAPQAADLLSKTYANY